MELIHLGKFFARRSTTLFVFVGVFGFGVVAGDRPIESPQAKPVQRDKPPKPPPANEDEAKVGEYVLPDPLISSDGTTVSDPSAWLTRRRPETLELFRRHVFGRPPTAETPISTKTTHEWNDFLGGKARAKIVRLTVNDDGKPSPGAKRTTIDLLVVVPAKATKPVPMFLGLSFGGNHAVCADRRVPITEKWMRPERASKSQSFRADESTRGNEATRWPLEKIIDRGYGVATAYYGDIEPDHVDGWRDGVRGSVPPASRDRPPTEEADFADDDWGAIAAWAWGLSACLDQLIREDSIDPKRVAVIGHSRLGKTALWAGASDRRFALVISNNSGEGGAAIARRRFGETTANLNYSFPHWFNRTFKRYSNDSAKLPVDAHQLVALSAPRPAYVASASEDLWADPKGEFLACVHAGPVYRMFGLTGVGQDSFDDLDRSIGDSIGYHRRKGKHDVADLDWDLYMNFFDKHRLKASRAGETR